MQRDALGGEPWWVVIATMADRGRDRPEYASAAVDAPDADTAKADGQRLIVANQGREPERIARVTGPFPRHVPTEARERRPRQCGGCGLARFCGNHAPTPSQTWFESVDSDDQDGYECINCGTVTWLPEDHMEVQL